MQNFRATIQVAEDAKFRKTVLDAIKLETDRQIKLVLSEHIREVLSRPEYQQLIRAQVNVALASILAADENIKTTVIAAGHDVRNELFKQVEQYLTDEYVRGVIADKFQLQIARTRR